MRESCTYGSVRGASSNGGPYRNRREFIAGLGSAVTWPLAARAQQPVMASIGILSPLSPASQHQTRIGALVRGLAETGFIDGRNLAIEYRWADGRNELLPALAADLVSRKVAVLVAIGGTPSALAAKAATKEIPIVFQVGSNTVEFGLVRSLARPGGNLTGVTSLSAEVIAKRVELLHELVPAAVTIALLVNPASPFAEVEIQGSAAAASVLGVKVLVLRASNSEEIADAFMVLDRQNLGALVIGDDPLFTSAAGQLVALTLRHKIASIYQWHEVTAAGGLMSYGQDLDAQYRIVGIYTGRILHGERPVDLPVQQATNVRLTINLRTAKALGLTFPEKLLATADEVIE
jgi:putative tryptophan/tyrosine transport system substrate-binding protein